MRFLEPNFLWLLPLVVALWFWPRAVTGRADLRAFLLRAAALVLVVLALARPVADTSVERGDAVVVLDASGSATAAPVLPEGVRDFVRGARRAALVTIGAVQLGPKDAELFDARLSLARDGSSSPLGAALEAAGGLVPSGVPGAVLLFTDARATRSDFAAGAQALAERGIPTFVSRTSATEPNGLPLSVEPLGTLRVGHTGRVRVRGLGATDSVRLESGDGVLAEAFATSADGRFDAVLEFEPPTAGFVAVRVVAAGGEARATLAVQDPLRVAYLGGRIQGGGEALGQLLGAGFDVRTTPRSDDGSLDEDAAGAVERLLGDAPLVVLDDMPAEALPEGLLEELAERVEQRGTGLVMSGGSAAFGPGGYADTALEAVLPVDFVQREEKRDPSTTLVVIIDTSGSMGGERVQLAKEVARLAIQRLLPHDKVGLVEFYGAKRWAAPIQPASNHIEIERAINRLDAGGGTVILPAIEEAYYGLQNIETRYKHVLVLTDGGVERGAFEPLLRRMADKGMTVSTVLVGGNLHSEFLVDIANWGKGRFYSVPNRFNIPEVLLKQPTSAQLPSYRTGNYAVDARGGSVWWGGERPTDLPDIAGYVESEARPGADVTLQVADTGQPLAASWMWGAGRVGAFMTEPVGTGTEPWSDWPEYGRFMGRFLARCASPDDGPYRFEARRQGHEVVVLATARFEGANANMRPAARTSQDRAFDFVEVGRGIFEARLASDPERELWLGVGHTDAGARMVEDRRLVVPSASVPEVAVDPADQLDLDRLAAATGGGSLATTGLRFGSRTPTGAVRSLAPLLALLAVLLYLVDVLLRRLPRRAASQRASAR
jgi:Ca-activated chloride channel homolog